MTRDKLRCFVERTGSSTCTAYCVDLDLVAEGRTCSEAREALDALLERYWLDRERRGAGLVRVSPRVGRRYLLARVRSACTDASADVAMCYHFRAPPDPVLGLA